MGDRQVGSANLRLELVPLLTSAVFHDLTAQHLEAFFEALQMFSDANVHSKKTLIRQKSTEAASHLERPHELLKFPHKRCPRKRGSWLKRVLYVLRTYSQDTTFLILVESFCESCAGVKHLVAMRFIKKVYGFSN